MKVRVAEQYPPIQVSHDGVIYRPGDEVEVPELVGMSWHRSGWVVVIEGPAEPPPDLSALANAVGDLQTAEAQLEQTAELAASPRGGQLGSEEST
jgi:hypothetical protein